MKKRRNKNVNKQRNENEKIVFLVGNNLDKRNIELLNSIISKDKNIRRLLFRGKTTTVEKILGILVALGLVVCNYKITFMQGFSVQITVTGIVAMTLLVRSVISDVVFFIQNSISLAQYVKFLFSPKRIRYPVEIWNFFQGSVSDIQMVNTAEVIMGNSGKVIYTGRPYFDNYLIDSIEIKCPMDDKWFSYLKRRFKYKKFYRSFVQKTLIAAAAKEYISKEEQKLAFSNSVFGVLYTSAYMKEFFETYLGEYIKKKSKENKKSKLTIAIHFADMQQETAQLAARLAEEYMKYCLVPEYFEFTDDVKNADCLITGISFRKESNIKAVETERMVSKKPFFAHSIVIPVKRFIALPTANTHNILFEERETSVICIGGAEQNLALQHIINTYRWSGEKGIRLGIAENAFESKNNREFLVGTEGLVYGIRDSIKGRLNQSETNKAEVFHIAINGSHFYSIYGLNAVMTKMSLVVFTNSLMVEKQMIPGVRTEISDLIEYVAKIDDKGFFKSNNVKDWDQDDCMNNIEKLEEWINKNYISIE